MSYIWSIVCDEEKKYVAVGQGYTSMNTVWSGEPKAMAALSRFLRDTKGKALRFVGEHEMEAIWDTEDFEEVE